MSLVLTVSNIIAPTIGDSAIFFGGKDPLTRFPPVREIDFFSFDITISNSNIITTTTVITPQPILSYTTTPAVSGITITNIASNSYRISGQATGVFTNRFFKFRQNDGTLIQTNTPINNYYAMYFYQPDNTRYVELQYTFVTALGSVVYYQTIQNDWTNQRTIVKQLVAGGK